jgi:hypothetical protein
MKKILLFLFFLLMMPKFGYSQVEKYKSVFTLNFIRYIGWSEESKQGDFVIGVLKSPLVADWLQKQSAGKKFGNQNVVIKEFKSGDDLVDCQVLYVGSSYNFFRYAEEIKSVLGKNSLLITESEGAVKKGSMINFVVRDDILKFEVSEANAQLSGLSVSSKLSNMGAAIRM